MIFQCIFCFRRSRNFTEAHQPVRSRSTAKRKNENLGNISVRIYPVASENRICMKVEIYGYAFGKYSVLFFVIDDRNAVYDRVTLDGKRVLK